GIADHACLDERVEVGAPDSDSSADVKRRELPVIDPLCGLPGYADSGSPDLRSVALRGLRSSDNRDGPARAATAYASLPGSVIGRVLLNGEEEGRRIDDSDPYFCL